MSREVQISLCVRGLTPDEECIFEGAILERIVEVFEVLGVDNSTFFLGKEI